jgi:hypothetical protein
MERSRISFETKDLKSERCLKDSKRNFQNVGLQIFGSKIIETTAPRNEMLSKMKSLGVSRINSIDTRQNLYKTGLKTIGETKHRICLGICENYKASKNRKDQNFGSSKGSCQCYENKNRYTSIYMKFYDEVIFKKIIQNEALKSLNSKNIEISLSQMFNAYKKWIEITYSEEKYQNFQIESLKNINEADLGINLNSFTPALMFFSGNGKSGKWIF